MTKSITVTKKEIIKALETEPLLKAGAFVEKNQLNEICNVCAVGTVLRSKGLNFDEIDAYGYNLTMNNEEDVGGSCSIQDVTDLLSKKRYMAALSSFYEMVARKNEDRREDGFDVPATLHERLQAVRFVEKNFPDTLKILLGEPASNKPWWY